MTEVNFFPFSEEIPGPLEFVVIVPRYQDKWLFVRHKDRNTWEFPGGHIEPGETVQDAGARELWEESGAVQAEITPVCTYAVTQMDRTRYGYLFFAQIQELGTLPDAFEMAGTRLTDVIPDNLTYPDILPALFEKIQGWRNLQSNAGELWDIYDENRCRTGKLHRRGDLLKKGEYHLVVHVWIRNREGKFLITKRSPNKGFPNMWESTGGSALAGDDSLTAALREVNEETGLTLTPEKGEVVFSIHKEDYFRDVWLFRQDFHLGDVVLQPGETIDKMYADKTTILSMLDSGSFVPYDYLRALFERID